MDEENHDPELERLLDAQVRSGRCKSRDEALDWLRRELKKGVDEAEAGRVTLMTPQTIEDIKRRGRERLAALQRREAS